jgi:hypothetical protein
MDCRHLGAARYHGVFHSVTPVCLSMLLIWWFRPKMAGGDEPRPYGLKQRLT